jgi:glycosyltransferase involved in cell wall biosynthesis
MQLSVVVCTHNRAPLLTRLIQRVREELDGIDGELVVVDNASTDGTRAVVELEATDAGAPVRYVYEPSLGLSHARNRGIEEARGEILVFVDDDALPLPGWAREHLEPYGNDERLAAVGGRIELEVTFAGRKPWWFSSSFHGFFGEYDLGGEEPRYYEGTEHIPLGGNMSLRRAALDDVGVFDPALGRAGEALLGAEEFELVHRLWRAHWRALYSPRAAVVHLVGPQRLQLRYFRRQLRWDVVTSRLLEERGFNPPGFRRALRLSVANLVYEAARLLRSRSAGDAVFHALRIEAHVLALCRLLAGRARRALPSRG